MFRLCGAIAGKVLFAGLIGGIVECFRWAGLFVSVAGGPQLLATSLAFGAGFSSAELANGYLISSCCANELVVCLLSFPMGGFSGYIAAVDVILLELGLTTFASIWVARNDLRSLALMSVGHGALNVGLVALSVSVGVKTALAAGLLAGLGVNVVTLIVAKRLTEIEPARAFRQIDFPTSTVERFAIQACDVIYQYPASKAERQSLSLGPLNLSLKKGESLALIGHNGAGKTTILRLIAGLIQLKAGRLSVFGKDPTAAQGKELRAMIGFVSEDVGLYGNMSVQSYLSFFAHLYACASSVDSKWVAELVGSLGLSELQQRKIKELSRGMRLKLLLVRALMHKPSLLLLDEPTAGLDLPTALEVRERLLELRRRGCTIVLATHDFAEAEMIADKIGFVRRGQIISEISTEALEMQVYGKESKFRLKFQAEPGRAEQALKALQSLVRLGYVKDSITICPLSEGRYELIFETAKPFVHNAMVLRELIACGTAPYFLAPIATRGTGEAQGFHLGGSSTEEFTDKSLNEK